MATTNRKRIKALETKLGRELPDYFLGYLRTHKPICEGGWGFRFRGKLWEVRTSYRLDSSSEDQLDRLYERVGDVLPPGALPFAADWAGNFYCLMLAGQRQGQVVYWDHEDGGHRVKRIAGTFEQFISGLETMPDEE